MAGLWYRTGTVSVTQASKQVTGLGTLWKTALNRPDKGNVFYGPDGNAYEIDYVTTETELYLVEAYAGINASAQSYKIDVRGGTVPELSRQLSAHYAYMQGVIDSLHAVVNGSGDVTITGPDGQQETVPSLGNMLSKSGNLAGLTDKVAARANLGAYKQGSAVGVDLDQVNETGEYIVSGTEHNWPFPGIGGHMYVHGGGSGSQYVTQIAVSGLGPMSIRCRLPSGWPPYWTNILMQNNVQNALTDSTVEKLMKVGAFGLGNTGVMPRVGDANSIQVNGWYEYNKEAGDINGPEPYGTVLYTGNHYNATYYQGWHFQRFFTVYGDMYLRHSALNTFAGITWRRVWSELSFVKQDGFWTPYVDDPTLTVTLTNGVATWKRTGNSYNIICHLFISGVGSLDGGRFALRGLPFDFGVQYNAAPIYECNLLSGTPVKSSPVYAAVTGSSVQFFYKSADGGTNALMFEHIRPNANGKIELILNISIIEGEPS